MGRVTLSSCCALLRIRSRAALKSSSAFGAPAGACAAAAMGAAAVAASIRASVRRVTFIDIILGACGGIGCRQRFERSPFHDGSRCVLSSPDFELPDGLLEEHLHSGDYRTSLSLCPS